MRPTGRGDAPTAAVQRQHIGARYNVGTFGVMEALASRQHDPQWANTASLLPLLDADGTTTPVDAVSGVTWGNSRPGSSATERGLYVTQEDSPFTGCGSIKRISPSPLGHIAGSIYATVTASASNLPMTFEIFAKVSSVYGESNPYRIAEVGPYVICFDSASRLLGIIVNGRSTEWSSVAFSYNTWIHLAVTYMAGVVKLYVNGNAALSFSESGPSNVIPVSVSGSYGYNGDYWTGYTSQPRLTLGVVRPITVPTAPYLVG